MPCIGEIQQGQKVGYKNNGKVIWVACPQCEKGRWVALIKRQPVSTLCRSCQIKLAQKKWISYRMHPPNWKGGVSRHQKGYRLISVPLNDFFSSMATKQGYIMEHRLVMAKHLGCCLQSWEVVHHKNGIKDDNRIQNLELMARSEHRKEHEKGYRDGYLKGLYDGHEVRIKQLEGRITLLEAENVLLREVGEVQKE